MWDKENPCKIFAGGPIELQFKSAESFYDLAKFDWWEVIKRVSVKQQ